MTGEVGRGPPRGAAPRPGHWVPYERFASQIQCLVIAKEFRMGRQADEKLPEMEPAAA
jgi:hypothetical protein